MISTCGHDSAIEPKPVSRDEQEFGQKLDDRRSSITARPARHLGLGFRYPQSMIAFLVQVAHPFAGRVEHGGVVNDSQVVDPRKHED
jgi:hypothetical protein